MTVNREIQELSVAELFREGQYTIPIYQRNYAWGESEVEQLLQDVLDMATGKQQGSYYIGSLVAYRRKDGSFETIDGQQRHTTLSILLSVLKNEYSQDVSGINRINLGFDSRPKSDQTLLKLFTDSNCRSDEQEERTIRAAYEVTRRFLSNGNKATIKQFTDYLLHQVKILRVVVPEDTDLNHYFEIMNNRGEQLEKHEVLKARLMSQLDNDLERYGFAKIWDACAEMNRYVQLGFETSRESEDDIRSKVFGENWNTCPKSFDEICLILNAGQQEKGPQTLAAIIANPQFHRDSDDAQGEEDTGTFSSVINFPNFLLHVLRVSRKADIPLDDKRLLDTFNDHKTDPHQFVLDLLKCRMLFDRYIIKRENDEDWSLKTLRFYERNETRSKRNFSYVNSAEDEQHNQQLIMLLSMFHVSFPAMVYKHWLSAALRYLYVHANESTTIKVGGYIKRLEKISQRFLYGRFGDYAGHEPIDYFSLCFDPKAEEKLPKTLERAHLALGTNVQNFIFNRLDYLLWKCLSNGETFDGVNMDYVLKRVKGFGFTFRTSVEHYYPRHPLGSSPIEKSDTLPVGVDTFGNLCLISHSNNSKLSNYLPTAKKEHYEKASTTESLKQVFMMSYDNWGPENQEVIAEHEEMMVKVLVSVI